MKGGDYAKKLAERLGLKNIPLIITKGTWNNYYVPGIQRIVISKPVYYGHGIAARSIAAHEVGHALQHSNRHWAYVLNLRWPTRFCHIVLEYNAKKMALNCIRVDFPFELSTAKKVLNRLFLTHLVPVVIYYSSILAIIGVVFYMLR